MKKIVLLASVVFCVISCSQAQKKFSETTLSQKLVDTNQKEIIFKDALQQFKGKTIVLEVWASWCGDCVKAMPKMKELQAAHPNVVYLFVSMDKEFDKWKAGIEKHDLKGTHLWANDPKMMKGEFGKSIKLNWIPRYMIIDKNQKIVLFKAIETDFNTINATLKSMNE